jgi:hypothetical protein
MPQWRADRSYGKINSRDLKELAALALADREDFFARCPRWRVYANRILCVALCQGAALHYLDGTTGVNDFDVWTFYAAHPAGFPYRRHARADFGSPKFGRTREDYVGRRVDLLARALPSRPFSDPVQALQRYLSEAETKSAKKLAEKAAVIIEPAHLLGTIAWPRV